MLLNGIYSAGWDQRAFVEAFMEGLQSSMIDNHDTYIVEFIADADNDGASLASLADDVFDEAAQKKFMDAVVTTLTEDQKDDALFKNLKVLIEVVNTDDAGKVQSVKIEISGFPPDEKTEAAAAIVFAIGDSASRRARRAFTA